MLKQSASTFIIAVALFLRDNWKAHIALVEPLTRGWTAIISPLTSLRWF